ncbi:LPP20 family lipoprotein [Alteromonas sp. ASW11-130]|uniref:LPP20 family lipoprotein n=1 Tax=Alteromonas sp. ASW11-130 TaxID=3015775 RepID=UPI0022421FA3|nr:LPP20 family lipoprotein [Alteromonas sp. ASW11-130]MCW8091822.1 LPP20 family lipoprotein [Alteromonas sp. ASW11-130]
MSISNKFLLSISVVLSLSACTSMYDKHVEWEVIQPKQYPVLKAVGYAPVDAQHGTTNSIKEIMAMKASKLDAYRELAEQVYGQRIAGNQSIANMVMGDTQLQASVEGIIRGARVVKSYPVGEDTYATELELDMRTVYQLYLSTAKPRQIKEVKYY